MPDRRSPSGPASMVQRSRAPVSTACQRIVPTGSAAEQLGDLEGELQGLTGVEARVAGCLVAAVQVAVGDLVGPAEALGDVLAGQLDVDAAGVGALGAVHGEEAGQLGHDVVEAAGLVARRADEGVAVHRVTGPHHRVTGVADGPDQRASRSETRAAPILATRVRRPGTRPGSTRSHRATTSAGVADGPSLAPTGLPIPRRNSRWAPSSWRVRSPTHSRWAEQSYQHPVRLSRLVMASS